MSFCKLFLVGVVFVVSIVVVVILVNVLIIDCLYFKVLGVVIVWVVDEINGNMLIVMDFVIDDSVGGVVVSDIDLIGGIVIDGCIVVMGFLMFMKDGFFMVVFGDILIIDDDGNFVNGVIQFVDIVILILFGVFDVMGEMFGGDLIYNLSFFVVLNIVFNINGFVMVVIEFGDFDIDDVSFVMDVIVLGMVVIDGIDFGSVV